MSKIVSKKILSLIIFFVIILILLFAGYKTLSDGFYIQNIKIGKLNIERLYLKLDNKLILDVGKLDVSGYLKTSSNENKINIDSITEKIKYGIWAISYFQKLSIKEIILEKNSKASIVYDGKEYILEFPDITAKFAIENNDKNMHLKILDLVLKNMGIKTDGNIIYSTQSRKLAFDLIISPQDTNNIALYLKGITDLKTLSLRAKSSQINQADLLEQPFLKKFSNPKLDEWLEKIQFSSFQIETANIKASLNKNRFLESFFKNTDVAIKVKNPKIYLEKELDPIESKQARVELKKGQISIDLKEPTYDSNNLDGSKIVLSNLTQSPKLDVIIVSKKTHYNQALKDLLANYHIHLPIDKLDSTLDLNLNLGFQFLQDSEPLISAKGLIYAQETNFLLYDIPLYTQNAQVSLDIAPEYKYVYINTTHTRYENIADIDSQITLDLEKDFLQAQNQIHKIQINTNNDINTQPYQEPQTTPTQDTPQEASNPQDPIISNNNIQENQTTAQEDSPQKNQIASTEDNTQDNQTTTQEDAPQTPTPQPQPTPEQKNYDLKPNLAHSKTPSEILKRKIIDAIKAEAKEKFTKNIFYATAATLPSLSYDIDFSTPKVVISIPELQLQGSIEGETYEFEAKDFDKIYPYSELMQYFSIHNGNARATLNGLDNIVFDGYVADLSLPLYFKDGKKITELSLSGSYKNGELKAQDTNQNISFGIKDLRKNIAFKNLDFSLDDFINSQIPAIKELFAESNEPKWTLKQIEEETHFVREKRKYERLHNIEPNIINLTSDNTIINYKDRQIPLDNINLIVRDGRVSADGMRKNGVLNLDIVHSNIFIRANNFSGDFVNALLKKNIVRGGLYTLFGIYRDDTFKGQLKLQNTIFKDFAVVQNIINLIDTIPSLIVFKNPNLGVDGYEIQKGEINFAINSKYIGFENINLVGTSMDVEGNGIIQLDSDEMNLKLTISTIKNLSNILNKIPIVGYLILGKEGKISTNVIVNGTLEKPKTEISLAEDAIKAPFNIFRRIFTPIDIIVDEIKNEMNKD